MKKIIIILGVFLFISAFGFLYVYQTYYKSSADIWQMVPGNAIVVYENLHTIQNWNRVVDKPVWKTLKKIPKFNDFEKALSQLDSITGKDGTLARLFEDHVFLASAHIISSTDFDFLIFLELNNETSKSTFRKIRTAVEDDYRFSRGERKFQDYTITELKNKNTGKVFSFLIYDQMLVGSFTPFLIDDVIRNINNHFKDNFLGKITSLQSLSKLENDEGNLYVDFSRLPELLSVFLKPEFVNDLKGFEHFANDTYLDLKITDNELLLNGISTLEQTKENKNFIRVFQNQNAQTIEVTRLLPQQTALFYHFTFSDFEQWQNELLKYWSIADDEQFKRYLEFEENYQLQFDWIGNEIGMAILEPYAQDKADQIIFIEIKDQDKAAGEVLNFTDQYIENTGDSLYMENYEDHQIIQVGFKDLPAILFGTPFSGFENSFFTYLDDYFIIGNSINAVKTVINEIKEENVWGKSIRHSVFLDNTLGESSATLMINTAKCWNFLRHKLNPEWAEIFDKYQTQITAFDLLAFQVSNLDNRYYTSIAIGHGPRSATQPASSRFRKVQSVYTMGPITGKPFVVRNHNNNKFELLVQDSLHILYLISNEGDILWGDSIGSQLTTEIYQVDYYNNDKLQYLFGTKNELHLLDRNGDYVAGYPMQMPKGKQIDHLSVVDYDNTKRYRFMVADKAGDIYLFDKERNNLEGWQPRKLGNRLSAAPFHLRVKGGDCMIGLQSDGVLNVMKRRGNMYPGFPINFNNPIHSPVFVDRGNDFAATTLTTVSDMGEIYQVNLEGKITNRKQLYRPTSESKFWLVPDALQKDYIIVRQDFNSLAFMDTKGELIFEKNFITSGNLEVQYYNFSLNNKLFIAIDKEQEFTYLYDGNGTLINFEPIETGYPVAVLFSSGDQEYRIYKCYNKQVAVLTFKR